MLNVIIMVHNQFSEMLLRGVFSNKEVFNVIVIPYKTYLEPQQYHIIALQNAIMKNDLQSENVNYVVVESNYSVPASTNINESLLGYMVDNFTQAKVIAYSGTTDSLIKALQFREQIYVLPKDLTFAAEIANTQLTSLTSAEITSRIVKMADLRTPGNEVRRNSCPFRLELTADDEQDLDNLFRLRSNSSPPPLQRTTSLPSPVTPLFSMQIDNGIPFSQNPTPSYDVPTETFVKPKTGNTM